MSYPAFSACFPTPAAQAPGILKSVHGQITAKIDESSKREFEDIMQERDVVRGLNELERLVGEAGRRREMGVLEGPGEAWVIRSYCAFQFQYEGEASDGWGGGRGRGRVALEY